MEILAIEWLVVFIQDFLCEILGDARRNVFTKLKYNKFQKELAEDIRTFCNRNECVYLNSSAFQYYIVQFRFVEEIIARATATKITKSNKEFLRDSLKCARNIAEQEEIAFGHNEERIIKDLYKLINDKVTVFFTEKLSAEQRIAASKILCSIADLRDEVKDFRKDAENRFTSIDESIRDIAKLSESKEKAIAELLFKSIWENDFDTIDKLHELLEGKSSSVESFIKAIMSLICEDEVELSLNHIISIDNSFVRDLAIKALLPLYALFNRNDLSMLESSVSSPILYEIVHAVNSKEYGGVFEEKIDNDQGTEIHSFALNKKMICEEDWLTKQIVLNYLYGLQIRNVPDAMQEIVGESDNWLNKLLVLDKCIDAVSNENPDLIDKDEIRKMVADVNKCVGNIGHFGKNLQITYYSVLLKTDFILREDNELENRIPKAIKEVGTIEAFIFMKRIERRECELDEIYTFSERTGAYWVLNNYFIELQDPELLIKFCKTNETIFEKNSHIFFLFIGALKSVKNEKERKRYIKKYKDYFADYYEFWNEYFDIEPVDNVKQEFVEQCKEGKIGFVFSESESLLIERLLQFQEYSLATKYIHRMELRDADNYKIIKYKAIIEQSKGNQVEALNLFRDIFGEAKTDAYVVDSILAISLMNNRKIEEKYIIAAEKIGSPRLLMLAAAAYKNNGDDINAKLTNKRAMLLAQDNFKEVFSQYLSFDLTDKNNSVQQINGLEVNTCAECKDVKGHSVFVCIEGDLVLPKSPYMWQGNIYMYKEDAAERGILRRHTGDSIVLDHKEYRIEEIIPLDTYYFRLSIQKMEKAGVVHTISIPTREGNPDVEVLTEWLLKNTKDEKTIYDWLQQYNNIEDVPLSLFTYKRFARFSYLQFVDVVFEEKNIFIREYKDNKRITADNQKYVLTFSAALMLYKIGFSLEKIASGNLFITSSTMIQVNADTAKIIEEYDRDTVASMGVIDGHLFFNQTDEAGKDFWIKEAGRIKKFFSDILQVENNNDLSGEFLSKIESKELLGICDYDAIAIAQNNHYVLVTLEAIHSLLAENDEVKIDSINLVNWIVKMNPSCLELLDCVKKMLKFGCLYSLNCNVLQVISLKLQSMPAEEKKQIYQLVDEIMKSLDCFEERIKLLAIQSIAEEVNLLQEHGIDLDRDLLHIMAIDILLLKRQKMEIGYDNAGRLVSYLRDMTEEEKQSVMIAINNGR